MDFDQPALPLEVVMQIEKICSEFESAWQADAPLNLEDSLRQVAEYHRPALLLELLLLEFDYQQASPAVPDVGEYCDRFPEHKEMVTRVWSKFFGSIESNENDESAVSNRKAIQAKYVKRTLHRKGGIGRIWIADDRNLNRKVALKDLQPQHTEDPAVRERFVREAQITGKLEHPGIVPVYQLRQGSEFSEPFYTMRLVEGKTLREVIAGCHEKANNERLKRRDQVSLLNTLMTVCQTIAYAHSQGVIHRDLKPDNIVVGDYGEVFVLDWGMAKLVDPVVGPPPAGTPIGQPALSEKSNRMENTLLGTRVGTPAYMAPEQAAGATDQIGIGTDVYGLGAILFEILTAQPPHQGSETDELLKQIEKEPTPAARCRNANVSPALEAICCKAMARDQSQRYATAVDLKNDIESWIADEPVACYTDPWSVRFNRWRRRHRNLINAAAVLLFLATVGLAIGNRLLNRAHQRTQQQKESAEKDFRQARSVIEGLSQKINSKEAKQLVGFKPLQRQLTQHLLDFYIYFLEQHRDKPAFRADIADVHYQLGLLASSLESLDSARVHFGDALELFERLSENEPESAPYKRKLSECYNSLGNLCQESGDLATAEINYLQASQILETFESDQALDGSNHQLQMTVLNNLATLYMSRGDSRQAITCFQRILAPPQQDEPAILMINLAARLNLAVLYRTSGNLQPANDSLIQAKQILDNLRKKQINPELLHEQQLNWYINQANVERSFGRLKTAQETSASGIQTAEALVQSHPGELKYQVLLAQLELNATAIWIQRGNFVQARSSAQKALLLLNALRDSDPENLRYQIDLARTLHNLARIERQLQNLETARDTIQRAIKEKQRVVERSPGDKNQNLLLSSRILHANFIRDDGEYAKALQEYRELHTMARNLVERNQEKFPFQVTLAAITHSLAQMEKKNQIWDQAAEHYQEALQLQTHLATESPKQSKLIVDISITQYNFGNLYQAQSDLEPALALYHDAQNTLYRLPEGHDKLESVQRHVINCHWAIAETSHALKQFVDALKHWDQAIELAKEEKFLQFLKTERQKTVSSLPNQR